MGSEARCLIKTSQLAGNQGQKEREVSNLVIQRQKKKRKIRLLSPVLSPENLQRKGREQPCPLDYVSHGFPEPHASL